MTQTKIVTTKHFGANNQLTSGSTIITRSNVTTTTVSAQKKGAFQNLTQVETSKPFSRTTHRTLRQDENPIDIIKEFIKSGGGGTLSLTDNKTGKQKKLTTEALQVGEMNVGGKTHTKAIPITTSHLNGFLKAG